MKMFNFLSILWNPSWLISCVFLLLSPLWLKCCVKHVCMKNGFDSKHHFKESIFFLELINIEKQFHARKKLKVEKPFSFLSTKHTPFFLSKNLMT